MNSFQSDGTIDYARIRQKGVKDLMRLHRISGVQDFGKLTSICYSPDDTLTYHEHKKTFLVAANPELVWHTYKTVKPEVAWNGKMVSFGIQYSRRENKITYLGDNYTCIEPGLIIILNLSLLGSWIQLAVAHEIVGVDEQKKEIKICYVEKGASVGSQWISLSPAEHGHTVVTHYTQYRGKSWFRDTQLYPLFHERALTEFHQNIIQKILKSSEKASSIPT